LRDEFHRHGYGGSTVNYPDFFWRGVGFGLTFIGAAG